MTKLTEPFFVASAGSTDGYVVAASGNDLKVDGAVSASSANFGTYVGDSMTLSGTVSASAGHFGGLSSTASAITIQADTTVEATARSSADALIKFTLNGTGYAIPAYTSAAW